MAVTPIALYRAAAVAAAAAGVIFIGIQVGHPHYRHRLSEARFHALRPGGPPLPSVWPELRAQLARVSATEGVSVPAQASAGETR